MNGEEHKAKKSGVQTKVLEVQAEDMTLKIASYWLCGCGPRIMAEDFFSANFAEEGLAGSLPELLVTTLLTSVLANVLGRDVTRTLMEGTSNSLRFVGDCFCHLLAIIASAFRQCCFPRPRRNGSENGTKSKLPKRRNREVSETPGSCGNCGSCLPCQALLQRATSTGRSS
eukprot:symbB.v1.2.039095.t1/scaffold6345.1/size23479/3